MVSTKNCKDCGQIFFINDNEDAFYKLYKLDLPVRCKHCRQERNITNTITILKTMIGKWIILDDINLTIPIRITDVDLQRRLIFYDTQMSVDNVFHIISSPKWKCVDDEIPETYHTVIVSNDKRKTIILYYKSSVINTDSLTSSNIRINKREILKIKLGECIEHTKTVAYLAKSKLEIKCLDKDNTGE